MVKVKNTGTTDVNIKGWKIVEHGHNYTNVFLSYTLKAKSTVTLYVGKGKNTANIIYWGRNERA